MTARTPQRINGRRIIVSKAGRSAHVRNELLAAHAAFDAHTSAAMLFQPTAAAALAAAETQLGKPYCLAGCRCAAGCGCRDCSGEVIYGINQAGVSFPCTSSFAIAQFCSDHGTLISTEEGIHTAGAIGVRNPWGDPNFNGSNGHVWYAKGDGQTTVEEGGRRTGCYRGSVFTKSPHGELVIYMRFPGLLYGPQATNSETDMILQVKKNGDPKPSMIQGRHCQHGLSDDRMYVVETNGASVAGDQRVDGDPAGMRRWYPKGANGQPFLGAGQHYIGIAQRANRTGIIVTRNDGAEASADYT